MKFILDKSQLTTFLQVMEEEPIYRKIKFNVKPHKDNGLRKWSEDSFWIEFTECNDEMDATYILQACLHTGLRHNFNKYFLKNEPCY